jgi:predicted esterase
MSVSAQPPPTPPPPRLFSVQQRRNSKSIPGAEDIVYDWEPCYVLPTSTAAAAAAAAAVTAQPDPTTLGELDALFAQPGRHPTMVELLVRVPTVLYPGRFVHALRRALAAFAVACGRRRRASTAAGGGSTVIAAGPGVQFSAVQVSAKQLHACPSSQCLFEAPRPDVDGGTALLTLRLASCRHSSERAVCGIGICFDHALCDVSGVALLLAHVSAYYTATGTDGSVAVPPMPVHAREQQSQIIREAEASGGQTQCKKAAPPKGGCACVQWTYSDEMLQQLKQDCRACSRHEALFADLVQLLRRATRASTSDGSLLPDEAVCSVTISRNDRVRFGLPIEHFGNGIVLVHAQLPVEDTADSFGSGSALGIAAALRAAIHSGVGVAATHTHADAHMNTWWHPLQRPELAFGAGPDAPAPSFAIGPGSLASVAQLCLLRGGQPNATVLPAATAGGLEVSLLVPLKVAHAVLQQIKARSKAAKLASKVRHRQRKAQSSAELQSTREPVPQPLQATQHAIGSRKLRLDRLQSSTRGQIVAAANFDSGTGSSSSTYSSRCGDNGDGGGDIGNIRKARTHVDQKLPLITRDALSAGVHGSVPRGHTYFSWASDSATHIPRGHTAFSWRSSHANAAGGEPRSAFTAKSSAQVGPNGPKKVLIWLHGAGDTNPTAWRSRFHELLPHISSSNAVAKGHSAENPRSCFRLPRAPVRRLSCSSSHQQPTPAWFDICKMPVSMSEPDSPQGLDEAIQLVHSMIDEVLSSTVAAEEQGSLRSTAVHTRPNVPAGHTAFSWNDQAGDGHIPCGHTSFSWLDLPPATSPVSDNTIDADDMDATTHCGDANAQLKMQPGDVMLGGFSQGGALAILAGLSYPRGRLGAVISMSGWCACHDEASLRVRCHPNLSHHAPLPSVFFSFGSSDPTVDSDLSRASANLLCRVLHNMPTKEDQQSLVVQEVQRRRHMPNPNEITQAIEFIRARCAC